MRYTAWWWLESWNFEWLSMKSWEFYRSQLTKSIIFQRGWYTTNQSLISLVSKCSLSIPLDPIYSLLIEFPQFTEFNSTTSRSPFNSRYLSYIINHIYNIIIICMYIYIYIYIIYIYMCIIYKYDIIYVHIYIIYVHIYIVYVYIYSYKYIYIYIMYIFHHVSVCIFVWEISQKHNIFFRNHSVRWRWLARLVLLRLWEVVQVGKS